MRVEVYVIYIFLYVVSMAKLDQISSSGLVITDHPKWHTATSAISSEINWNDFYVILRKDL